MSAPSGRWPWRGVLAGLFPLGLTPLIDAIASRRGHTEELVWGWCAGVGVWTLGCGWVARRRGLRPRWIPALVAAALWGGVPVTVRVVEWALHPVSVWVAAAAPSRYGTMQFAFSFAAVGVVAAALWWWMTGALGGGLGGRERAGRGAGGGVRMVRTRASAQRAHRGSHDGVLVPQPVLLGVRAAGEGGSPRVRVVRVQPDRAGGIGVP